MRETGETIGDYALIGDCRTAALVARDGSIDWLCLPDLPSRSVFAAVLDRDGGRFGLRPRDTVETSRRYLPGTNVLQTRFRTRSGCVILTDLMPILDGDAWKGTLEPARELLRVVECIEGDVVVDVHYAPRMDYARSTAPLQRRGEGVWRIDSGNEVLLLHTDLRLDACGPRAAGAAIAMSKGDTRYLSLTYANGDVGVLPLLGEHARQRYAATVDWWRRWSSRCRYDGPYRDLVLRSALVLKLLAFSLSGAVVAAATTSLPERVGGGLNWDYRYCWLRDAQFTLTAFVDLGFVGEAQAFLGWLLHSTRLTWPRLQVLYDVYGESRIGESSLDHFEGYRGSRPVRIGNGASSQTQLDVYGSVIAAAHGFVARGGRLQRSERRVLAGFGREVCRSWRDDDHSIWEVRGRPRPYTYSKLMCWVALDRLLDLDARGVVSVPRERFERERCEIEHWIEARGFDTDEDSYTGVLGDRSLDASLLLMGRLGYRAAADARVQATFARISQRLGRGALLHRYDARYSAEGASEGAFGACSFWAAELEALGGDVARARARFDALAALANDVGLYAEEIDDGSGEALGNYPQALTHAALVSAALAIAAAEGNDRG